MKKLEAIKSDKQALRIMNEIVSAMAFELHVRQVSPISQVEEWGKHLKNVHDYLEASRGEQMKKYGCPECGCERCYFTVSYHGKWIESKNDSEDCPEFDFHIEKDFTTEMICASCGNEHTEPEALK